MFRGARLVALRTNRILSLQSRPRLGIQPLAMTIGTMAGNGLANVRPVLDDLRNFWFEHCESEDSIILPGQKENSRWYGGGKVFDDLCKKRYAPALDAIRASGASGADLVDAVQPQTPEEWLALVLLLDQIPRNTYRGNDAAVVFRIFDPLAREVTTAAMERGITEAPEIRWRMGYRVWFYLPLMHSEDLAMHDLAMRQYEGLVRDVEDLLKGGAVSDEHQQKAAAVVKARGASALADAKISADFEKRHQVIIQRFGRYPHRNEALGREHTAEEREYLDQGGETF